MEVDDARTRLSRARIVLALGRVDRLSERERVVLELLGDGLSNSELAKTLGIAEPTARTHVTRVLSKLDLRSRLQAGLVSQLERWNRTTESEDRHL